MKKKPIHYFNKTFRKNYWFFIGWDEKYFEDYLKKFYDIETEIKGATGRTIQFLHGNSMVHAIWVSDKKRLDILAHECVHASNMTLYGIGVPASYDNDEVQAYLVQDLFTQATGGCEKQ